MDPRPLRWLRITLPMAALLHGVKRVDAVKLVKKEERIEVIYLRLWSLVWSSGACPNFSSLWANKTEGAEGHVAGGFDCSFL
jgi:hypothetical protein